MAPAAQADLRRLDARWRAAVIASMRRHLRQHPTRTSRARIKRLRGLRRPQFRLRVDDSRVFYDVEPDLRRVEVLRIISKSLAQQYLTISGVPDEIDSSDQS